MSSSDALVKEIFTPEEPGFNLAMNVYNRALPNELKQGREVFAGLLRQGDTLGDNLFHLICLAINDKALGMASFNYLRDIQAGFLGYIAVEARGRGKGFGKLLLDRAAGVIVADARKSHVQPLGIFTEIERPQDTEDKKEQVIRKKRAAFFKNHGFLAFQRIRYVQPALEKWQSDLRLHLLFWPFDPELRKFSKAAMTAFVQSLYKNIYEKENQVSNTVLTTLKSQVLVSLPEDGDFLTDNF
jgi:GNAT superfamily N-acetyltransferase